MKITSPVFITHCFLFAALIFSLSSYSQKKDELFISKWASKNLQVDGKLNDWSDSLAFNAQSKLYYNISNNDTTIFVAFKSADRGEISKILNAGISFSVNTLEKKKTGATITFPIAEPRLVKIKPNKSQNPSEGLNKMQQEMLSRVKSIRVNGFKDIMDGSISLYNTYGIKAATTFNAKDELEIELAIPLSSLGNVSNYKNIIYYNIKINGYERTSNVPQREMNNGGRTGDGSRPGGGMYGGGMYGGGMGGMNRNKVTTSTDFWIKSILAKNPNN